MLQIFNLLVAITEQNTRRDKKQQRCYIIVFGIADLRDAEGSHPHTISEMTPFTSRDFK